jgi:hypothetical protein
MHLSLKFSVPEQYGRPEHTDLNLYADIERHLSRYPSLYLPQRQIVPARKIHDDRSMVNGTAPAHTMAASGAWQLSISSQYFKSYAAPLATLIPRAHLRELSAKTWPKRTHIPINCGQSRIDYAGP